jgi:hypothetical protein
MFTYTYNFSAYKDGLKVRDEVWETTAHDPFQATRAAGMQEAAFMRGLDAQGIAWERIDWQLLGKA